MSAKVYQDQSADELRLSLWTKVLDLSQLTILREGHHVTSLGTLRAGIIGASHFLHFNLGSGRELCELFACTDIDSPDKRAALGPLRGSAGALDLTLFGEVGYRFRVEKRPMQSAAVEMERIESLVREGKDGLGILHEFPASPEQKGPPPKTIVHASEPSPHEWRIETVHAYPNDGQLVVTRTTLNRLDQPMDDHHE